MQDLVSSIDDAIKERREEIRLLRAAKDALRAPAPRRPRTREIAAWQSAMHKLERRR